jgi:hypothetical protein
MVARFAIVVLALLASGSALAETMTAEAARRFVAGKLFSFSCFDGSRGAGRIYADGSVIGTVQFAGASSARSVWLPAGTLQPRGDLVCASIQGMTFQPCFKLERTGDHSFRGSMSGFGLAYCDFTRRQSVAGIAVRAHPSRPFSVSATRAAKAE